MARIMLGNVEDVRLIQHCEAGSFVARIMFPALLNEAGSFVARVEDVRFPIADCVHPYEPDHDSPQKDKLILGKKKGSPPQGSPVRVPQT